MLLWGLTFAFTVERLSDVVGIAYTALYLIALAWFLWAAYVGVRRHSLVIFERRSEAKTFLEQNRNAILMTVVTSIISGAIGYGFGKLKDATPTAAPAATTVEKPK
jgi:hypothetical protein